MTNARMERMEAALRFYADPRRYQGPNQQPLPDDPYAKPDAAYIMDVTRDNGRIAKAALSDTSTDRPAARFLCLCCEEVEVKKDGDECEFCRITYSVTSPVRPCPGCDGHECDSGCAYPGAVSRPVGNSE